MISMVGIRRVGVIWPAVSFLVLLLAACSSDDGAPASATATTAAPAATEIVSDSTSPKMGEMDLSGLPDDPTELMLAILDVQTDQVARKMAYSGNRAYIPVMLEILRFQNNAEGILDMTSFLSRLKDNVPPEEVVVVPPDQREWRWWVEWLGNNPDIQPPEGFAGWKGQLYSLLDPDLGAFLYDGVKSTIRIEEIVWGGVFKDGIPDLTDPPVVSAADAEYLLPDDRVFGVSFDGEHRAYPLRIMNPHEMANDIVGGVAFALAY